MVGESCHMLTAKCACSLTGSYCVQREHQSKRATRTIFFYKCRPSVGEITQVLDDWNRGDDQVLIKLTLLSLQRAETRVGHPRWMRFMRKAGPAARTIARPLSCMANKT